MSVLSIFESARARRFLTCIFLPIMVMLLFFSVPPGEIRAEGKFDPGKASFAVRFKKELSPYRTIAVFALPGEEIDFSIQGQSAPQEYAAVCEAGIMKKTGSLKFNWTAPAEKGLYRLYIFSSGIKPDTVSVNAYVIIPYSELEGEYLNGYRIGKYPDIPLKQLAIYKKPRGFIEVTEENENTLVSPHFQLKQFVSKQSDGYPKYMVLREKLILKLELILEKVNEAGYACDSFVIMSGYRTPYYNKAIGNVKYSRHVWGGAADIYIDVNPVDEYMDDLNRDGVINYNDAAVLYNIVDEMYGQAYYEDFTGGLGWYRKTAAHGPFVHVDVRGFRARWGD